MFSWEDWLDSSFWFYVPSLLSLEVFRIFIFELGVWKFHDDVLWFGSLLLIVLSTHWALSAWKLLSFRNIPLWWWLPLCSLFFLELLLIWMLNFLQCLQFCYFFLSDVISLSFCSLFSEITSVFSSNLSIELFYFPIFKAAPWLLNILSDNVCFLFRVYCFSNPAHLDVPPCFLSVWNVLPADTCTAYCLSSIRVWLPWSFIWNYNPAPTSFTPVCPESLVFSFFLLQCVLLSSDTLIFYFLFIESPLTIMYSFLENPRDRRA